MAFQTPLPFDSFDHYNTSQIFLKWTGPVNFAGPGYVFFDTSSINPTAGRCGTGALQVKGSGPVVPGCGPSSVFPAVSRGIWGVAVSISAFAERTHLFRLHSGGTDDAHNQVAIGVNNDGTLFAVRAADHTTSAVDLLGGVPLGVSGQALNMGVFYYVEVDVTTNNGAGAITVYVNGVAWLTLTGLNTDPVGSGTMNSVQLGRVGAGGGTPTTVLTFDDFYQITPIGATPTARLGDQKVAMRLPLGGNGDETGWTPVPGPNHGDMVNQLVPDGDTTYVSAQAPGTKDSYLFPALDIFTGVINGVAIVPCARKDDAGFKQLQALVRIAGVDYLSAASAVPSLTSYACFSLLFPVNPTTSGAWDVATVNAMQPGVLVET